jgi:molecular chaperone DnaJ
MAAPLDHYAALGVAKDADPEVIRAAYRVLAKKYHPDTSPDKSSDNLHRFRQISEAHSVLSDIARRAEYDAVLEGTRSPPKVASAPSTRESYGATQQSGEQRPSARSSFEKVRNGVVVVGWSLLGGFIILLILAVVVALLVQFVRG